MPPSPRTLLCSYRYDPLNRLISRDPLSTGTLEHFYCKARMANEVQGAVRRSIVQHGDQLLAQQGQWGSSVSTSLLAMDQQRSILNAIDSAASKAMAYTPYGFVPMNGLMSLLGFNGERPDPVTGNYLLGNGYRQFNPVLMRFISPDALSPFEGGGINAYAYCSGDPVNSQDPSGRKKVPGAPRAAMFTAVPNIVNRQALKSGRYWKITKYDPNASPSEQAERVKVNTANQRKNTRMLGARIEANEKGNLGQTSYTTSSYPLASKGVDQADLAYKYAKHGYGFEVGPDIHVPHWAWDSELNKWRLDVMHFDAAIYKSQRFASKHPNRGYALYVHKARILRAEYIWKHTGINYLDDMWWISDMGRQ